MNFYFFSLALSLPLDIKTTQQQYTYLYPIYSITKPTTNTLSIFLCFFILLFVKHQYHSKIDDQIDKALASMTQGLINKLVSVLEATLGKLARYDEGSLIGSLLSFTVKNFCWALIKANDLFIFFMLFVQNVSGSGKELGQGYVNFTRNNIDLIRSKINDDLWILNFFEQWYTKQITILCNWLSERLDHGLHVFQCTCLAHIVKVSN